MEKSSESKIDLNLVWSDEDKKGKNHKEEREDGFKPVKRLKDLSCTINQIAKFIGGQWVCSPDKDSFGDLSCPATQVLKSTGVAGVGNPWRCEPDDNDPNTDTLAGLSCNQNQIAEFIGNNWVCSDKPGPTSGQSNSLVLLDRQGNIIGNVLELSENDRRSALVRIPFTLLTGSIRFVGLTFDITGP